jgi:hypothetical protein
MQPRCAAVEPDAHRGECINGTPGQPAVAGKCDCATYSRLLLVIERLLEDNRPAGKPTTRTVCNVAQHGQPRHAFQVCSQQCHYHLVHDVSWPIDRLYLEAHTVSAPLGKEANNSGQWMSLQRHARDRIPRDLFDAHLDMPANRKRE